MGIENERDEVEWAEREINEERDSDVGDDEW